MTSVHKRMRGVIKHQAPIIFIGREDTTPIVLSFLSAKAMNTTLILSDPFSTQEEPTDSIGELFYVGLQSH
jgi:hypothetical protein